MRAFSMRILVSVVLVTGTIWVLSRWGFGDASERTGIPMSGKLEKKESEWKKELTEKQFHITRQKGTERAFTGAYWNTKEPGVYQCVCCGQTLFTSDAKF